MSSFRICDGDECDNTENGKLYKVPNSTKKFMEKHFPYWNHYNDADDLCQDCVDQINDNYKEPLLVPEGRFTYCDDIIINKIYLENINLLKDKQ